MGEANQEATRGTAGPARGAAFAALGILLLGAFAYSNSLRGAFVFDDIRHIRENAAIRDISSYLPGGPGYREIPNRSFAYETFALNYRLTGPGPAGFHAVNLAIHLANALLVFALVALLFQTPRLRGSALSAHSTAVAFGAGALFATHPLGTQAVTYVVQRFTSLATLFYLLAAVAYLLFRLERLSGRPGKLRGAVAYAALLSAAALAVRTKEVSFTLPLALALVEALFLPREGWRRFVPIAPVAALAALVPLSLPRIGRPAAEILPSGGQLARIQATVGRLDYLRTEVGVVAEYLRLLAFPAGQNVDPDIPICRSFFDPRFLLPLAFLSALALLAGTLWVRTGERGARRPLDPAFGLVAFGLAWFFLTVLPESSLIPIPDVMNEHRAYLPSVGVFVATAAAAGMLFLRVSPQAVGRATVLASLLGALALGSATLRRNVVWSSEIALWADAAEKSPAKFRPQFNLGTALVQEGHFGPAAAALRRAAEIDPASSEAHAQLGAALMRLGRVGEAEAELREALLLAPDDPESLINLGLLLARQGRREEARPLFRRFLEVAPSSYADARRIAAANAGEGPALPRPPAP